MIGPSSISRPVRVINAIGARTDWGGRVPSGRVRDIVSAASGTYVNVSKVISQVESEIANVTRNEAALVTRGAAAGLLTAVLAAVNSPVAGSRHHSPLVSERKVAMHRVHRSPFDQAFGDVGIAVVEFGTTLSVTSDELEAAIDGVQAVIYLAGGFHERFALDLRQVCDVAKAKNVPVIVDAAGQLPPVSNLWHYTRELGATAAVFSGGKDLAGPYDSGFIVGSSDFLDACREIRFPSYGLGRAMKIAPSTACGLVEALYEYTEMDHDDRRAIARRALEPWYEILSQHASDVWIDDEDYFPQLVAEFSTAERAEEVCADLLARGVASDLATPKRLLVMCAQCVEGSEVDMVTDALTAALGLA